MDKHLYAGIVQIGGNQQSLFLQVWLISKTKNPESSPRRWFPAGYLDNLGFLEIVILFLRYLVTPPIGLLLWNLQRYFDDDAGNRYEIAKAGYPVVVFVAACPDTNM